ncbi:MAG TPA: NifU family protein [Mycobacteriales bacterium]|nr:NifU family protein [Mycobacteriales bacterium]
MEPLDRSVIERALDEVRPHLHGEIELVDIVGAEVRVRLLGRCADCTMAHHTLRAGVEQVLRARVPGVATVVSV